MPLGFQDVALAGVLGEATVGLILKMVDEELKHNAYVGDVWSGPYPVRDLTLTELTGMVPGLTAPNDESGPALERLLCLVLMWCRNGSRIPLRTPACMSHSIVLELVEKLPLRDRSAERAERECLLWISLMTLDSWPAGSYSSAEWLRKTVSMFPEIADWKLEDFERFGERFIWTPHLSNVVKRHRREA